MLKFGLYEMKKHGTEMIRKMIVVNYANAEKLTGNRERSLKILDQEDWSATADNYRICVAAIRDEIDSVIALMPKVVDAKLMTVEAYREWPVFERIRSEPRFIEAFEREFGQKLLADREGVKPRDDTIGGVMDTGDADEGSDGVLGEPTIH